MKTGIIITIAIVAILLIGGGYYLMKGNYSKTPATTPAAQTPASQAATKAISIANFAFSPASLTIKAGDTVIWTNQDTVQHQIASDSGTELASQLLSNEGTYSHTFNQVGTYNYHCAIHTSMKGTIIVQ